MNRKRDTSLTKLSSKIRKLFGGSLHKFHVNRRPTRVSPTILSPAGASVESRVGIRAKGKLEGGDGGSG